MLLPPELKLTCVFSKPSYLKLGTSFLTPSFWRFSFSGRGKNAIKSERLSSFKTRRLYTRGWEGWWSLRMPHPLRFRDYALGSSTGINNVCPTIQYLIETSETFTLDLTGISTSSLAHTLWIHIPCEIRNRWLIMLFFCCFIMTFLPCKLKNLELPNLLIFQEKPMLCNCIEKCLKI